MSTDLLTCRSKERVKEVPEFTTDVPGIQHAMDSLMKNSVICFEKIKTRDDQVHVHRPDKLIHDPSKDTQSILSAFAFYEPAKRLRRSSEITW